MLQTVGAERLLHMVIGGAGREVDPSRKARRPTRWWSRRQGTRGCTVTHPGASSDAHGSEKDRPPGNPRFESLPTATDVSIILRPSAAVDRHIHCDYLASRGS